MTIFQSIYCAIVRLGAVLIDGMVLVVNALIAAVGFALGAAVGLLPAMPDRPAPPSDGILAVANWFFPLGAFMAAAATMLVLFIAFQVVAVILRWARAI